MTRALPARGQYHREGRGRHDSQVQGGTLSQVRRLDSLRWAVRKKLRAPCAGHPAPGNLSFIAPCPRDLGGGGGVEMWLRQSICVGCSRYQVPSSAPEGFLVEPGVRSRRSKMQKDICLLPSFGAAGPLLVSPESSGIVRLAFPSRCSQVLERGRGKLP